MSQVVEDLKAVLADSCILCLKTQNFHWNVTGPNFQALHLLFEGQYQDLFEAMDEIAERIRTLGVCAPGAYAAYANYASVSECVENISAEDMVKELAKDQDVVLKVINKALSSAQEVGDEVTVGLLVERIAVHEKARWVLSSSLTLKAV